MRDPKRHRHEQTEEIRPRDPLVPFPDREELVGERPGDGLRVVLLGLLAGPDVGAFDGEEDVALVVDDGVHHDCCGGEVR